MSEHEPMEVYPLAQFLCEEMEARGWTTADVAVRMPGKAHEKQMLVDLLIAVHDDKMKIDDRTFDELAVAFGVSGGLFRNLHATWMKWPDRRASFVPPEEIFKPHLYDLI